MVTPLLGWQDDSRPCDCAQEPEDCITACGERLHRNGLKGGGVFDGGGGVITDNGDVG